MSDYGLLRKRQADGEHLLFHPLLAAGLGVERGHKLCKERTATFGTLTAAMLSRVSVSGETLQLKEDDRWRKLRACTLLLRRQDAALALDVVKAHRKLFSNMSFNVWDVDVPMPAKLGHFDVLGDFSTGKNFGAHGTVWVELKVRAANGFDEKLQDDKNKINATLAELKKRKAGVDAVMLVAARVEQLGASWQLRGLVAELKLADGSEWQKVAGRAHKPITRGRSDPRRKPAWQQVLDKLEEWKDPESGEPLYLLNHFLKEMRLPCRSLKKRSAGFHQILRSHGINAKFVPKLFPNCPGQRPIVGTEEMFRCLWEAL